MRFPERAGFTLIEIMIVISILAIVLATGVPAMLRTMQKEGLRKAEADLLEACAQARAQAILSGTPMDLVIRAEDSAITVGPSQGARPSDDWGVSEDVPDRPRRRAAQGYTAKLEQDIGIRMLSVNFKDHMEFPEARVRFFPNGTSDEFTIVIFSNQGTRVISLDVVTALADVTVIP